MAAAYKLTYFDTEGAAEGIRYLFNYGGIEFEDERIPHEQWPQLKPSIQFGALPVLTHNGKTINQSVAISRYLAKLVGLSGKNEWEDLEIDSIVDTIMGDWKAAMVPAFREKDEEKKKVLFEELQKTNEFYLTKLNEIAAQNNGHLAVGRLTWADVILVPLSTYITGFDKYPNLVKLVEKVHAIPNIKKWLEKRPPKKN